LVLLAGCGAARHGTTTTESVPKEVVTPTAVSHGNVSRNARGDVAIRGMRERRFIANAASDGGGTWVESLRSPRKGLVCFRIAVPRLGGEHCAGELREKIAFAIERTGDFTLIYGITADDVGAVTFAWGPHWTHQTGRDVSDNAFLIALPRGTLARPPALFSRVLLHLRLGRFEAVRVRWP
jgi:hypothetical protein